MRMMLWLNSDLAQVTKLAIDARRDAAKGQATG